MIIHTINFEIEFDMINLPDKDYFELLNIFLKEMNEKHHDGIPFEELIKIIPLDKLKYHPSSVDFPDLEHFDPDLVLTKETKIRLKA